MYNEHHRQGKPSQYTWENVAIVPGGRAGLIRIAAVLNQAYLGFFIPDYTAYNEMLSLFRNVSPIASPLSRLQGEARNSYLQVPTILVRCHSRALGRGGWLSYTPG